MAIGANRRTAWVPIAAFAAGILLASVVGATAQTNVGSPGKVSVGSFGETDIDPPEIPAASCDLVEGVAPGIEENDRVVVQTPIDLEADLTGTASVQDSPGNVVIRICNVTAAAFNGASRTWTYLVIR